MRKVFDWHQWNAETYEEPEDIIRVFESLGVRGKKIASIRMIGFATSDAEDAARLAQHEAGVPRGVIDRGGFAYSKKTLVPCVIEASGPMVITFTDGSTFELQPRSYDSLWMSVNQIPKNIIDGTNHVYINASEIFRDLIGATLDFLIVETFIKKAMSGPGFTEHTSHYRRYQFRTDPSDDFEFSITPTGSAPWFEVKLHGARDNTYEGYVLVRIPLRVFDKAFSKVNKKLLILEGKGRHDSYYGIQPVRILDAPSKEARDRVEKYDAEEISIEEGDVSYYLSYFLKKYFDDHVQVTGGREGEGVRRFGWYGVHNLYTYESAKQMIAEIRATANMFRSDFDNPALSEVKKLFNLYRLNGRASLRPAPKDPDQYRDKVIRANIGVVLDFYDRFCRRMELMMEHAPQLNMIAFDMRE